VLKNYVRWADAKVTRAHRKGAFRVLVRAHSPSQATKLAGDRVPASDGKQGVVRVDAPFGRNKDEYWK